MSVCPCCDARHSFEPHWSPPPSSYDERLADQDPPEDREPDYYVCTACGYSTLGE